MVAPEAEAARVEISRRLLAAADQQRAPPTASNLSLRRTAAVIGPGGAARTLGGVLPAARLAAVWAIFPWPQRTRAPDATQSLDNLVAQVEAHLEKNPTDGRGWNVLAPVLTRLGRYDEAVRAFRNSITYNGDSADAPGRSRRSPVAAPRAASSLRRPRPNSSAPSPSMPDEVKARYFLGLAAEQDGRRDEAASIWRAMLEKAPPDAPWRPLVQAASGAGRRFGRRFADAGAS